MSPEELAGLVCQTLADVSIWSRGQYLSRDLDFIEEGPVSRKAVEVALERIGFVRAGKGRHFSHPETEFFVEFPQGPQMVGHERVRAHEERQTSEGVLRLLSPIDCVKDRLAAYFHWDDRQALSQAILVAKVEPIDLGQVRCWADGEDAITKYEDFERELGEAGSENE